MTAAILLAIAIVVLTLLVWACCAVAGNADDQAERDFAGLRALTPIAAGAGHSGDGNRGAKHTGRHGERVNTL